MNRETPIGTLRGGGDALCMYYFFNAVLGALPNNPSELAISDRLIGKAPNGYTYYNATYGDSSLYVKVGYCYYNNGISAITYVKGNNSCISKTVNYKNGVYNYTPVSPIISTHVVDDIYRITSSPIGISVIQSSIHSGVEIASDLNALDNAINDGNWTPTIYYPIHYNRTGCTLTAPADAAPGQDCVVIVNPSEGYTFKGSSGVRIQDSSGANVPFIVSGNRISFTYPQPI